MHMRPIFPWFDHSLDSPLAIRLMIGSVPDHRADGEPAKCPESLRPVRVWPHGETLLRLLGEHYSSFIAPTDSFASRSGLSSTSVFPRWRSLRRLSPSPCCSPDLPDVISEKLSLDAGSHAPAVPQRALTCFFRCVIGLPHKELGRLPAGSPLETTSCGRRFRGGRYFFTFRPPIL